MLCWDDSSDSVAVVVLLSTLELDAVNSPQERSWEFKTRRALLPAFVEPVMLLLLKITVAAFFLFVRAWILFFRTNKLVGGDVIH